MSRIFAAHAFPCAMLLFEDWEVPTFVDNYRMTNLVMGIGRFQPPLESIAEPHGK